MSDIVIVPMTEEHIPELARLEKICFSTPWNEQMLSEELDNHTAYFRVAMCGDVIAGYIGIFVVCESCYISNIAVFPEYRGKGIGSSLIECACSVARENGAGSLSLEVRPSNEGAVRLYMKNGFEEVGLRRNFYRKPQEDALILTKDIVTQQGSGAPQEKAADIRIIKE